MQPPAPPVHTAAPAAAARVQTLPATSAQLSADVTPKIPICHATGADDKWVNNAPSASGDLNGHVGHQDGRDIIPPFDYIENGEPLKFLGQNWDDAGKAIYNNDCTTPPPPVYAIPTVQLTVDQCTAPGGTVPTLGTITLSGLTAGQQYTVTVQKAGSAVTTLPLFTATGATATLTADLTGPGDYTVTAARAETKQGTQVGTVTVTVTDCPDEPAPPVILLNAEQCTDPNGTVPGALLISYSGLLPDREYTLSITSGSTTYPAIMVRSAEGEGSITAPLVDGAGTYSVTLSFGTTSVSEAFTVRDCPDADVDLSLVKSAGFEGDAVELGDTIRYTLTVSGTGTDRALNPVVTDTLPSGLTFAGGASAPDGWTVSGGGTVTATFDGAFSGSAEISFDALVTAAPADGLTVANRACVTASGVAGRETAPGIDRAASADARAGEKTFADTEPGNDCGEATVPFRSVTVSGSAVCLNDTPWFTYTLTPTGIADQAALPISLIWWTPEAYANRDSSIAAGDHAGILANGASQVDAVAYPDGWSAGQQVTGRMLWPGAAIDAAGNPTAWPGWKQLANGSWVEDPTGPFAELRGETIVEIRINPTAASATVYPPASPDCAAQPPVTPEQPQPLKPPAAFVPSVNPPAAPPVLSGPQTTGLAATGATAAADSPLAAVGGLGLLTLGIALLLLRQAGRRKARS